MRFRGCFRQCNGKIPLKLNGRPHFCRRSTVLAFCGSPCRVCAGYKSGRSPIAPPGRSWRPSAAVSRPPGGWGGAPPCPPTGPKGAPPPPRGARPAAGGWGPRAAAGGGAGPAGPLPAQTYPTGISRSIGCNCRPSSAAASAAPVRESSAARLVGFFRGSSCPKGTK